MINKNFKKILYASLAVTAFFTLLSVNYGLAEDVKITTNKINDTDQEIISYIDSELSKPSVSSSSYYIESIFQKNSITYSKETKSLYELGDNWEILSTDYVGSEEPFNVEDIIITARLIDDPNNARQCEFGTEVRITIDVDTGKIKDTEIPTVESKCLPPIMFGPPSENSEIPDFIQQAHGSSDRAFLIAGQGNSGGNYGGYGKIKIPSFDETANPDSIYTEQDQYIGYLYNQMINGKFFQVGWTALSVDSTLGPASKYLIYVDQNTFGDYGGHKITDITWKNDADATVYIQCGSYDDYYIYMNHNGKWFAHDTNYDCDNVTDNNTTANSVFLENVNTVSTSEWSDEITSSVKAWNMREFNTKSSTSYWDSATNTYEHCPSGTGLTSNISSSLELGGSSVWTVSGIDGC